MNNKSKTYNYYIYDSLTGQFKLAYKLTRKQYIRFFGIHVKFKV